jgi:hypothetical protein
MPWAILWLLRPEAVFSARVGVMHCIQGWVLAFWLTYTNANAHCECWVLFLETVSCLIVLGWPQTCDPPASISWD